MPDNLGRVESNWRTVVISNCVVGVYFFAMSLKLGSHKTDRRCQLYSF